MAATTAPTPESLKRLNFVQGACNSGAGLVDGVYKRARGFVPAFAEPQVKQLEDTAASLGAPYLNWAQDTAQRALAFMDGKVDFALNTAGISPEAHDEHLKTFETARAEYFTWIEKTVEAIKEKLNPYPYVQSAADTLKVSLDKAVALSDPDKVVDAAHKAWEQFAAIGPVAGLLKASEPVVSPATTTALKVADGVLASPLYATAYNTAVSTLSTVEELSLYKKAKDLVYPVVKPIADPVYENFTRSHVVKQVEEYLKPKAAKAA